MSKITDFSIGDKFVPIYVIEQNIMIKSTCFANYGIFGSAAAYIYKQYFDYAKRYNIDIPQDIQNFYDQFITLNTFMDFNILTKDNIGDYFAYKCSILDSDLSQYSEKIIESNIRYILDLIDIARKNNIDIGSKLTIEQKNFLEFYKECCIFSDYGITSKSNKIYLDFDKVGSDQHIVADIMESGDM